MRAARDEAHVVAGMREPPSEEAAHAARTHHCDLHGSNGNLARPGQRSNHVPCSSSRRRRGDAGGLRARAAHGRCASLADEAGEIRGAVSATTVSGSRDRKSTRLNSSHMSISYAVFCLKKKKQNNKNNYN